MCVCETGGKEVNEILSGLKAERVIVNYSGGECYLVSECGVGFPVGEGLH